MNFVSLSIPSITVYLTVIVELLCSNIPVR